MAGSPASRRARRGVTALIALLATISAQQFAASAHRLVGEREGRAVDTYQVSFRVTNSVTPGLPCPSDGAEYEIKGTIAGPHSDLKTHKAETITLLLHGFSTGSFQWYLTDVPGYSHIREMAALGQTSLTIDRLGYDASGHPNGFLTCYGAAANMAHQIVQQLRTGTYEIEGGVPFKFKHVILAGHDTGGYIAQIEAYTYKDIDGLVIMGWADQEYTDEVGQRFFPDSAAKCAQGGDPAEPGGPGGYVQYPSLDNEEAMRVAFVDAPPEVRRAFFSKRNKNPCGDVISLLHGMAVINPLRLREIEVPVLLVFARDDFVWTDQAGPTQKQHFATDDLTYVEYQEAGHFFMFDDVAKKFRDDLGNWLNERF